MQSLIVSSRNTRPAAIAPREDDIIDECFNTRFRFPGVNIDYRPKTPAAWIDWNFKHGLFHIMRTLDTVEEIIGGGGHALETRKWRRLRCAKNDDDETPAFDFEFSNKVILRREMPGENRSPTSPTSNESSLRLLLFPTSKRSEFREMSSSLTEVQSKASNPSLSPLLRTPSRS
jgi:hypothetical protein